MKTQITDEQIKTYQEQGFLVVEDFLDASELERWRTATQEAVDDRLAQTQKQKGQKLPDHEVTTATLTNQADPDSYYAQVFTQCLKLAETHDDMRQIIFDPALGKVVATLAGVDGIRVWHDQALFKPPYGNPTSWHLDNPFWSFSSPQSISIWVALDDATFQNGCMYYVPGTHKSARYDNVTIGEKMGDLFKMYPEWRAIEPVACPCPAGSAVFHNGLTAHGAGANMTNKPRRAMTCAFMPDGASFNGKRNILPEDYFNALKIGDPLNDDRINPLVWHK
jgi:ectoine hydroxylase-related dioxygenase (phytanoyl-CoA dioxygenase family)